MVHHHNFNALLALLEGAKRQKLKDLIYDKSLPLRERLRYQAQLSAMPRNSAKTRLRNRCVETGRPRGYYRRFGISRIALRQCGNEGMIPGLRKSSW